MSKEGVRVSFSYVSPRLRRQDAWRWAVDPAAHPPSRRLTVTSSGRAWTNQGNLNVQRIHVSTSRRLCARGHILRPRRTALSQTSDQERDGGFQQALVPMQKWQRILVQRRLSRVCLGVSLGIRAHGHRNGGIASSFVAGGGMMMGRVELWPCEYARRWLGAGWQPLGDTISSAQGNNLPELVERRSGK